MKKIAFINQRYGKEVNGGSEYYTMLMAQKLKKMYHVEVLTSKARTYDKWKDYYHENVEDIDGIIVRRFGVKRKRNCYFQRLLKELIIRFGCNTEQMTALWNIALGPYVPELIEYINKHKEEYDVFIFVTYMYYPTVFGMEKVADKSIFVPTAHDEYNIYFKIYEKLFHLPRKIVYLTEEEKQFIQENFHNEEVENCVLGVGVDVPEDVSEERFRQKYGIMGEYIIYAGRVDADKGCGIMFEYFMRYMKENDSSDFQLVVIGKAYMDIPGDERIHYLGFVTDMDKYDAIKGAKLLWLPSQYESLSIAVLEAMAMGIPVIVNGKCGVLRGHCERSGGGMWYLDYEDFKNVVTNIIGDRYSVYCNSAEDYVKRNYSWERIITEWEKGVEDI